MPDVSDKGPGRASWCGGDSGDNSGEHDERDSPVVDRGISLLQGGGPQPVQRPTDGTHPFYLGGSSFATLYLTIYMQTPRGASSRPFILAAHSMGCPTSQILKRLEGTSWKDRNRRVTKPTSMTTQVPYAVTKVSLRVGMTAGAKRAAHGL